ncbi:hypothetical protein [Liquorilactobacillus oeni]|uniref:Uncharacterized protein n=1 Tax=Liquorilactobacillus oeni DSM 19972 TaxID=1423777 RepID=A0A0R1MJF9_9LACO|nr:hypothetical protein [Liquorilactobacillus oeni]KRL05410.1 hypothetical protein FD46_GL000822 [Liquorilactobacillus oeni DSM 19972]
MGRRTWLIVTLIIAVIFIGYGYTKHIETMQYYRSAFNTGEKAIKKAQYLQAENYFRDALKKKPNDKSANVHLMQVIKYRAGLKLIKEKNYARAQHQFHEVTQIENGSQILVQRAASNETELKEVLHELEVFEKNYQRAKILSTNYEYTASNTKLAVILGYGNINQSYYDSIHNKAKKLEAYNNRILSGLGYHVTDSDSSSTGDDADSLLSNSQGAADNSESENQFTKKEIKQARKILDNEGIDSKAFSDQDVREVLERAKEQGVSVSVIAGEFK